MILQSSYIHQRFCVQAYPFTAMFQSQLHYSLCLQTKVRHHFYSPVTPPSEALKLTCVYHFVADTFLFAKLKIIFSIISEKLEPEIRKKFNSASQFDVFSYKLQCPLAVTTKLLLVDMRFSALSEQIRWWLNSSKIPECSPKIIQIIWADGQLKFSQIFDFDYASV